MKILIISQYFWPESFRINDLAQSLYKLDHEVTVLTGLPNYPAGKWMQGFSLKSCGIRQWNGVTVARVPLTPRKKGKKWQLAMNFLSFAVSASIISPFLCRDKYDVIFTYEPSPFTVGIPAVILKWIKKSPMIFWVQDLWPESLTATGAIQSKFILRLVGSIVRWIYKNTDLVLVQSNAFIKPAIAAGANPNKTIYYPNWAEAFYKPIDKIEQSQTSAELPDGFIVMFAGNLGEAQSLPTITRAADRLREYNYIHWIIIGDGRRMSWMQDEVKRLNLQENVHFLGRKPVEEMPGYFADADVLLATLKNEIAFEHTIPSKIQSYMACGKPIICAINGEAARVVQEAQAGLTVTAENDESLAESVLRFFNMEQQEKDDMGKAAYKYYSNEFEKNMLVNKLDALFKQLKIEQK